MDSRLLRFFLEPEINKFSDEYIHLTDLDDNLIRLQIELMVVEYAYKNEDTQALLKPMTLTLIMLLQRRFGKTRSSHSAGPIDRMIQFMEDHLNTVTLNVLAERFSYHPSYISSVLTRKTGRTFSQILLSLRMERALFLMKNTDLSIEEVAGLTGYPDKSNFYKAFKGYYGEAPRKHAKKRVGLS